MAKVKPLGPEEPTIIERIANVMPGPFFLKCLVFWVIFGTPGMVLTRYLDTFNVDKALALFSQFTLQNVAVFSLANFVMPFYAFLGIHYMRLKIVEARPELEPVIVDGATTLNESFGSISNALPAIALAAFFGVVSIASFPGQTQHVAGYLSLIVKVVGLAFAMLSYGTFVWIYARSISGLHHLGKERLSLVPFYEDRHLGMKSMGSVSLSFAWVYFLGIGLVFFSFNPLPLPTLVALLGLTLLGIILFFLPLHVVHVKMVKEKHSVEKALRKRLSQVMETPDDKEEGLRGITEIIMFQMLEQKVSKISEWPFDTATLSWFSAIVITIVGTIITRYLLIFLGL